MSGHAGRTLAGRFQVVEPIGTGGMASVHRGVDLRLNRDVAVKLMLAEHARDPELRKRFDREALAMARLRHPHIVEIFELGQDVDGAPFIVSELVHGVDLATAAGRLGPVPWELALWVVERCLDGLAELHGCGIVHRDLKPSNILITADGVPKIADLGVAHVSGTTTLTGAGVTPGTLAYMPPEAFEAGAVTPQFDLWAMGCVLYELASGVPPFQQAAVPALINQILRGNFAPLDTVASVDHRVSALVGRMLCTSSSARPASARAVGDDCRAILRKVDALDLQDQAAQWFGPAIPVKLPAQPVPRPVVPIPATTPSRKLTPVPPPAPASAPAPGIGTGNAPAPPRRSSRPVNALRSTGRVPTISPADRSQVVMTALGVTAVLCLGIGLVLSAGSEPVARAETTAPSSDAARAELPAQAALPFDIERAERLFLDHRYDDVAQLAQQTLAQNPEDHQAVAMLTRAQVANGRPELAEPLIRKASELRPSDTTLLDLYAEVELRCGRFVEAEAIAQSLLKIKPDEPSFLGTLAEVQLASGQRELAAGTAQRALARQPEPWLRRRLEEIAGPAPR